MYPVAHDRNRPCGDPPGHEILSFLARLREEPESDEGSSPDEGVPGKYAGHRGNGPPMKVGVGYVQREFCDGQSLASPGRWPPGFSCVSVVYGLVFGTGMFLALHDSPRDRKVAGRSRNGESGSLSCSTR